MIRDPIRDSIRDPIRDPIHDPIHDPIRDPIRSGPIQILSTSSFCRDDHVHYGLTGP